MTLKSLFLKERLNHSFIIVALLLVVSLLWLVFNLSTLLKYPTVVSDESLVALVSYRMTTMGQMPNVSQFDPFGVYPFRLYLVWLAQWFNIFGLGLIQGRTFSLLAGYLAGWGMFVLGRELYDLNVGVVAGVLFWFAPRVFWTSHFVRPEMWVSLVNIFMLWLAWRFLHTPNMYKVFFVGFLSIAILDVYLSAFSTTLVVGTLALYQLITQRKWRLLSVFIGGGCLGLVYYLVMQFAPDWHLSFLNWQSWITRSGRKGSIFDLLLSIPNVLLVIYLRYSLVGFLETVYFCIGVWVISHERRKQTWYILGLSFTSLIVFSLLFASPWHALDALPGIILVIAVGLVEGCKKLFMFFAASPSRHWQLVSLVSIFVSPLLISYCVISLYYVWANRDYDYVAYVNEMQQYIEPQDTILGEGTWWWGFMQQPYWWDEEIEEWKIYPNDTHRMVIESIMRSRHITTVLMDENLGLMPEISNNEQMRDALRSYLTINCQMKGVVSRIAYGIDFNGPGKKETRVYACTP